MTEQTVPKLSFPGRDSAGREVTIELDNRITVTQNGRLGKKFLLQMWAKQLPGCVEASGDELSLRQTRNGKPIILTTEHAGEIARYCDELVENLDEAQAVARADKHERQKASLPASFTTPLGGERWQYALVNTGSFNTATRLEMALAQAGAAGWELVTIYDKASNWLSGMEKGFALMKRPVPIGVEPDQWCIHISMTA